MVRAALSWTLWPLGVGVFIAAIIGLADLSNPSSIMATMGITVLASTAVLTRARARAALPAGLEVARQSRHLARPRAFLSCTGQVGGVAAQVVVFLAGVASLLEPLQLPSLWPATAPILVQVLLVMLLGDGLEYWLHRLSHREVAGAVARTRHSPHADAAQYVQSRPASRDVLPAARRDRLDAAAAARRASPAHRLAVRGGRTDGQHRACERRPANSQVRSAAARHAAVPPYPSLGRCEGRGTRTSA